MRQVAFVTKTGGYINGPFDCAIRSHAWQHADGLLVVDGTVELVAQALRDPERRVVGLIHGQLERPTIDGPFVVPIGQAEFSALIAEAQVNWDEEGVGPVRFDDGRFRVGECRVAATRAPTYAGKAREILETRFALGSEAWMQDWPLEVSAPARLREFCAFYDETTDPLVRFDVMQLALCSFELHPDRGSRLAWFEQTLRRDFALHGHTVAYWAALE